MTNMITGAAASLVLLAMAGPAAAEGPALRVSSSVDYASGDYGLEDETTTWAVPVSLAIEYERITVFAEVAWLQTEGPAGAGLTSRPGLSVYAPRLAAKLAGSTSPEDLSANGLGDAMLGATFTLTPMDAPAWIGLTTSVTLPTGDEAQGLGTGTSDVTVGLDGETWIGNLAVTGGAGYVLLGDTDEIETSTGDLYAVEDGFGYAVLGSRYDFASGHTFGVSVSWSEAIYAEFDDQMNVTASGSLPVSQNTSISIYAFAGLAGDGADAGGGLSLTYRTEP